MGTTNKLVLKLSVLGADKVLEPFRKQIDVIQRSAEDVERLNKIIRPRKSAK